MPRHDARVQRITYLQSLVDQVTSEGLTRLEAQDGERWRDITERDLKRWRDEIARLKAAIAKDVPDA